MTRGTLRGVVRARPGGTAFLGGSRSRTILIAAAALFALAATLALRGAGAAPSGGTFAAQTAFLDGGFPSLRHAIRVRHVWAFKRAIARARAGQTIDVMANVKIGGRFTGFNRVIKHGTVNVVFESGAGFVGTKGRNYPALWIKNSGGWRIWGGTITNPQGSGILMYATPGPFVWTGFDVSDTANTCVSVFPINGDVNDVTLKGVAGTSDPDIALDPHGEKGTGIQAWNIADGGSTAGVIENSTFAADTVDQATGSAVEVQASHIGPNVTLYVRARHVGFAVPGTSWTGDAQHQVAGNAVQIWGSSIPGNLDIRYVEADDIQGRILETSGASPGSNDSGVSVDYGIATGPILQNSRLSRVAYNTGTTGIRLGDVAPLP